MQSTAIPLRFVSGGRPVCLRELTGHAERRVLGTSTEDALQLLEAILGPPPGKDASSLAEDLVASDRDRILAAVYVQAFGDRIESTLRCEACGIPFDIHFSLRELSGAAGQRPLNQEYVAVGANLFEAAAGWRFRLPTGRDERDATLLERGMAENILFERCLADTGSRPDVAALHAALDEVAPLIEFDLKASCPECRRVHLVQFDIQTYLLRSLLNEQGRLISEIHRLAVAYGWSLDEILSLTRTERRKLVELVEKENSRRRSQR